MGTCYNRFNTNWIANREIGLLDNKNEPRHEKTNVLHMRKQRRRSTSR